MKTTKTTLWTSKLAMLALILGLSVSCGKDNKIHHGADSVNFDGMDGGSTSSLFSMVSSQTNCQLKDHFTGQSYVKRQIALSRNLQNGQIQPIDYSTITSSSTSAKASYYGLTPNGSVAMLNTHPGKYDVFMTLCVHPNVANWELVGGNFSENAISFMNIYNNCKSNQMSGQIFAEFKNPNPNQWPPTSTGGGYFEEAVNVPSNHPMFAIAQLICE